MKETTAEAGDEEARVSRQRRANRSSSSKKFTATWQNELVRSPHHERVLERVIEATSITRATWWSEVQTSLWRRREMIDRNTIRKLRLISLLSLAVAVSRMQSSPKISRRGDLFFGSDLVAGEQIR
ncbi:hypothetical protein YC2023_037701 [Brassica napus]